MGLSSSTSKSSTKPIYSSQIEGAANNINSAYAGQAPKITGITDQLGTLVPGLLERYTQGTPTTRAANDYVTSTLTGGYTQSPELAGVIERASNQARNQTAAALGTRGLTGGSAFGDIISRNVGNTASDLAYTDYNNWQQRRAQAAGMVPSLSAAGELPLQSILEVLGAQAAPLQAANGAGAGVGGLLGQYTNGTQKQGMNLFQTLLGAASNAAGAIGGF